MININPLMTTFGQPQFTGYVTPDALMAFCQTRLQGIDTQVQASFAAQQQANADSTVLSDLSSTLSVPTTDIDLSSSGGIETAKASADAMMQAAQKLQGSQAQNELMAAAKQIYARIDKVLGEVTSGSNWSTAVGNNLQPPQSAPSSASLSDTQIEDILSNYHANNPNSNDTTIDVADMTAMSTTAVENIQKDLNSSTELSMINLQSLMSQRQEAIQLCTNLVQSLGDQVNKIAENVGH